MKTILMICFMYFNLSINIKNCVSKKDDTLKVQAEEVDDTCPEGYNSMDPLPYCAKFVSEKKLELNYYEADRICKKEVGYLAFVKTKEMAAGMNNKTNITETIWVGAHQMQNGFEWDDETPLTFKNWAPGYPNKTQHCVSMKNNSQLVTSDCNNKHPFFCMIDKADLRKLYKREKNGCPKKYSPFEDRCYSVHSREKGTFSDGDVYCRDGGSHLAAITSNVDSEFLRTLLDDSVNRYWIGAYFLQDRLIWSDGSLMSWKLFADNKAKRPSMDTCFGVQITKASKAKWKEAEMTWSVANCVNETAAFICGAVRIVSGDQTRKPPNNWVISVKEKVKSDGICLQFSSLVLTILIMNIIILCFRLDCD